MELRLSSTWNLCTVGSVICFLVVLFLNKNDQIINLWASTTWSSIQVEPLAQLPNITGPAPVPAPAPAPAPALALAHKPLELSKFTSTGPTPGAVPAPSQAPHDSPLSTAPAGVASPVAQIKVVTKKSFKSSGNYLKETYHIHTNTSVFSSKGRVRQRRNKKKCNMFDGKWVYKADGKPSYMASQCPFLEEKMSCQRNMRPDNFFEKWTWVPNHCDIPLLNGTDMVERFRNKRVIFVGDSLNRNMWASLACILYSNIPNASSKVHINFGSVHRSTLFKVKDEYNMTVEFYWSPYLVEHNTKHLSGKKVLVLDKPSPNSEYWVGADIMIFNSGMHWIQKPPKKGWDLYEYKGKIIDDMPLHIAYKYGMKTWAKWVQENVNPKKTSIFYRSISAEHLNKKRNQWCVGKTKPIVDESYVSSLFPQRLIRAIEDVIKGMRKSQVKYLNITKLSRYRIDAHPSIYKYKDWKTRAKKDYKELMSIADCGHWCLPGVPDTWNRMLYAYLYFDSL